MYGRAILSAKKIDCCLSREDEYRCVKSGKAVVRRPVCGEALIKSSFHPQHQLIGPTLATSSDKNTTDEGQFVKIPWMRLDADSNLLFNITIMYV